MDELLPVLVARLAHRDETVPALEAALRHGVAFLALEEAPSYDGPHALEIHTPDLSEPLLLLAEPAGEALGREYPLLLKPFAPEHEEVLLALLAEAGVRLSRLPDRVELVSAPAIALGHAIAEELELEEAEPGRESMEPGQSVGRILAGGKYSIDALIGSGGMGSVYSGTHRALEKPIAIKVLHPSHRHNEDFLAAFHREALAASRLDHPNVVQVLDFGQEADGLLYITMELLHGMDLRAALEKQPIMPTARIVDIMSQVCAALSASHEQNVVHRDIKPENILLVPRRDDDGTVREVVKVCDFGIAEILGKQSADEGAKRAVVAGTPDYMSPEQVRGGVIDARADVYACGVVVYEMATGKVPFHAAETPEEITWSHVEKEAPAPSSIHPGVDRALEALIARAMSKDPARRPQTARELRAELRAVAAASSRPQTATPHSPHSPQSARPASLKRVAFDDTNDLPLGVVPSFQRNDAIDIGDLFSTDLDSPPPPTSRPGAGKNQLRTLGDRMASELERDAAGVMAHIESLINLEDYDEELATLEHALPLLASRGAAIPVAVVVSALLARARGAAPGTRSREAMAARALGSLEKPERLVRLAAEALDGAATVRDPARKVLVLLGAPGAHALAATRERASVHGSGWGGRPRFVAAMRDIGGAALPTLGTYLHHADARDSALLEDLLRAIAEAGAAAGRPGPTRVISEAQDQIGTLVSTRDLRHPLLTVRRVAALALAAVWGSRANPWLSRLLEETDDGLRISALVGLRKHGGVDRDLVRRLERILTGAVAAGPDLRASAAAALADTTSAARAQAVEALSLALRPAHQGFLSKLVTADAPEDAVTITAMAQVLLTLAGAEGVRVVEARAAKSGPELKRQLQELLAGRPLTR